MRRGPPGQWCASNAYTLAMPSGIQTYWQMWALSHSDCGVLNFEGTPRQLLPASERCTIDWSYHAMSARCLPVCPCRWSKSIDQGAGQSCARSLRQRSRKSLLKPVPMSLAG